MRIYHLAIFLVLCVVGYVVYQHYQQVINEEEDKNEKAEAKKGNIKAIASQAEKKVEKLHSDHPILGNVLTATPMLWPLAAPIWGLSKIFQSK